MQREATYHDFELLAVRHIGVVPLMGHKDEPCPRSVMVPWKRAADRVE